MSSACACSAWTLRVGNPSRVRVTFFVDGQTTCPLREVEAWLAVEEGVRTVNCYGFHSLAAAETAFKARWRSRLVCSRLGEVVDHLQSPGMIPNHAALRTLRSHAPLTVRQLLHDRETRNADGAGRSYCVQRGADEASCRVAFSVGMDDEQGTVHTCSLGEAQYWVARQESVTSEVIEVFPKPSRVSAFALFDKLHGSKLVCTSEGRLLHGRTELVSTPFGQWAGVTLVPRTVVKLLLDWTAPPPHVPCSGPAAGSELLWRVRTARNHYAVLDVPPTASATEIKTSFMRLARLCHPDRAGNESTEAMTKVNEAWTVLRDPTARSQYDASAEYTSGLSGLQRVWYASRTGLKEGLASVFESTAVEEEDLLSADHVYYKMPGRLGTQHHGIISSVSDAGVFVIDFGVRPAPDTIAAQAAAAANAANGSGCRLTSGGGSKADRREVREVPLRPRSHDDVEYFLPAGCTLYRAQYGVSRVCRLFHVAGAYRTMPSPPADVLLRAQRMLSRNREQAYHLFTNNCEDFSYWCKTGLVLGEEGGQTTRAGEVLSGTTMTLGAWTALLFGGTALAADTVLTGLGLAAVSVGGVVSLSLFGVAAAALGTFYVLSSQQSCPRLEAAPAMATIEQDKELDRCDRCRTRSGSCDEDALPGDDHDRTRLRRGQGGGSSDGDGSVWGEQVWWSSPRAQAAIDAAAQGLDRLLQPSALGFGANDERIRTASNAVTRNFDAMGQDQRSPSTPRAELVDFIEQVLPRCRRFNPCLDLPEPLDGGWSGHVVQLLQLSEYRRVALAFPLPLEELKVEALEAPPCHDATSGAAEAMTIQAQFTGTDRVLLTRKTIRDFRGLDRRLAEEVPPPGLAVRFEPPPSTGDFQVVCASCMLYLLQLIQAARPDPRPPTPLSDADYTRELLARQVRAELTRFLG